MACLKVGSEIPNASVTDYLRSLTAQPSPDEGDDGTGPGWAGGRGGDDEASLREISGEDRGSGRRKSHSSVESEGLLQVKRGLLRAVFVSLYFPPSPSLSLSPYTCKCSYKDVEAIGKPGDGEEGEQLSCSLERGL